VTDLVRLLIDIIKYIWPFDVVKQWQRGVLLVCGRHCRLFAASDGTYGPGLKLKIPYFMEWYVLRTVTRPISTPLLPITLRDGTFLSFSATIHLRVVDAKAALFNTDLYEQTALEDTAAVLCRELMEAMPGRADPEQYARFRRLLASSKEKINECLAAYGCEAVELTFTNYVYGARTYRLLSGNGTLKDAQSAE
jgi:regulator of protease activity HflC (stomatin/prohibitin superfamily)